MVNKTKKYKTRSYHRTKRKYHKKKLLMKRKKQKKQSKKQNKLNNKIKSRKRGGQKTQTQTLLERKKKSQSNKQKVYNAQETKAINKFRLGVVNYHKGPIEIFIKNEQLPVSFDRLKEINLKFSEMLEEIELDYSVRNDNDFNNIKRSKDRLFAQQNAEKYIWYGIARGHRRSDENKESKINGYIIHGTIEISDNFSHLNITNICGYKSTRDANKLVSYLMSEENTTGKKIWKNILTPVSSKMIEEAFSELGVSGELDLNGYQSDIKLLEVLFKMRHNESDTGNMTFKNFKHTLFSDKFKFNPQDRFPFFWMNLGNIVEKYNEEMKKNREKREDIESEYLLTSLDIDDKSNDDDDDDDDLLLSNVYKKIMRDLDINKKELDALDKLTIYLNDDNKFKTDGDFSLLFDNILNKYKKNISKNEIKILKQQLKKAYEKLKKLSNFEKQMNDPEGMFAGIIKRSHVFDISLFQKWFDKNSVLFNQYLFPVEDTIKSFEQCPKLNKCYTDEDDNDCKIFPYNLRPHEDDRLVGAPPVDKTLYVSLPKSNPEDNYLIGGGPRADKERLKRKNAMGNLYGWGEDDDGSQEACASPCEQKSWCHKLTHCDTGYYCNKPHRNYQVEKSPLEEMRCSK